jgi:hypothetical protein
MLVTTPDRTSGSRPTAAPDPGGRSGRLVWASLVVAALAVLAAVLLPLAPVRMNTPTVTWPVDPQRISATMLELTNQQPLSIDVRFSCSVVPKAASTADGVLFSTLVPGQAAAVQQGLLAVVADGRLRVTVRGAPLLDEPVSATPCTYAIQGAGNTVRSSRNGVVVATVHRASGPRARVLPDVDVLTTSVRGLSASAGDELSATIGVDDQFNTTPTPVKNGLLVVLIVASAASLLLLLPRWDAHGPARPRRRGLSWRGLREVSALDVAVPAVMILWLFLAPASDDDGYYAAMARNSSAEGFVGNYYQLLNQSFTPFTWFYRVLGWWEHVGNSPALLRVPALVAGLLTWLVIRWFARPDALPESVRVRRHGPRALRLTLAAAFLAWWLPYGMGVRPEAIVGLLSVVALVQVRRGILEGRLAPLGWGIGAAGLAVACHPTGFVALGPVFAGLPGIVGVVRTGWGRWSALARGALLIAPGALASAVAFADGTLHDFLRGEQIFLSIQSQSGWYDEYQRYTFLFASIPMGSYARRVPVVLGLLSMLWFFVVSIAAHARRIPIPEPLSFAAKSLALSFLLLWLTPSKWTHHFGALSGVGPVFLALFLLSGPALVSSVWERESLRLSAAIGAVGSAVLAFALALHGPNDWAYSWLLGLPHAHRAPYVWLIPLDSPLVWLAGFALLAGVLVLVRRRRGDSSAERPAWLAVLPVLAVIFLILDSGYLVGTFSAAAVRTLSTYSPGASSISDPLARHCAAAQALRVGNIAAARPLPAVPAVSPPAPTGAAFVSGAGFLADDPPPTPVGTGIATRVWGSLAGNGGDSVTGRLASPWFRLPTGRGQDPVGLLAAGRLGRGNTLTAEFGKSAGAGVPVVATQILDDRVDSPDWRTLLIDRPVSSGADVVRLVAVDGTGGPGGWLAVTAPASIPFSSLQSYISPGAAVATAWQIAFNFPCQRQPVIRNGITEPVSYGVVWGSGGEAGLTDNTWQVFRGGLFAPVRRTSAIAKLVAGFPAAPQVTSVQVYRFRPPYPTDAYRMGGQRVTRYGWQGPS